MPCILACIPSHLLNLQGYKKMKRTDIKRRPLADTVLATLEPESKEYRELDGNGLYFPESTGVCQYKGCGYGDKFDFKEYPGKKLHYY